MEAVGGASAVLAVLQVGFSLARTLSTYIGDYKDARESIISLAGELDTTITQINELNALVENTESAAQLNENSRKLAKQCVDDSDRLIKRLVHLLTKAQLPEDPGQIVIIKPEDISVDRLTKVYWPWVKPQVDVVKSELFVMKQNILLARSCLQSRTGDTPALKSAGEAGIVAHAKSLHLARQVLRRAKAAEQQAQEERIRFAMAPQPPETGAHVSEGRVQDGDASRNRPAVARAGSIRSPSPRRRLNLASARTAHGGAVDDGEDAELMAQDLRKIIVGDIEREQAESARQKDIEDLNKKKAVQAFQTDISNKFAQIQVGIDETRDRLDKAFGAAIEEKKMNDFLEEQRSRQVQNELGKDLGEMLLKFGIGPSLRPDAKMPSAPDDIEEASTRDVRRRYVRTQSMWKF